MEMAEEFDQECQRRSTGKPVAAADYEESNRKGVFTSHMAAVGRYMTNSQFFGWLVGCVCVCVCVCVCSLTMEYRITTISTRWVRVDGSVRSPSLATSPHSPLWPPTYNGI